MLIDWNGLEWMWCGDGGVVVVFDVGDIASDSDVDGFTNLIPMIFDVRIVIIDWRCGVEWIGDG